VKNIYSFLIAALITGILCIGAAAQTSELGNNLNGDLTGSWLVDIACTCGKAAKGDITAADKYAGIAKALTEPNTQAPFNAVASFSADGTFSENAFVDYLAPQGTPARGVWERVGGREFAVTFFGVIYGTAAEPEFQGTYKVRWKIFLGQRGETFSGPYRADVFAPDGSLLFSFDGTASARRAKVERLP
jgi:hypothetical protein